MKTRVDLKDETELKAVFKLYHRALLYFSNQYVKDFSVAEEIVSDVFIKIWEYPQPFDDIYKLRSFLYVMTKNASLNFLRTQEYKVEKITFEDLEEQLYKEADVLKKIVQTELIKTIYDELENLPEKQREVFLLSFIEGLSSKEISDKLHITVTAVYANKSRAIAKLRESLSAEDLTYMTILLSLLQ